MRHSWSDSWEDGGNGLIPKPHNSVTDTPSVFSDFYTLVQAADSSAGQEFHRVVHRVGDRESSGWGYCISPGWCCKEESALSKKNSICGMRKGLSTGILVAVPSALCLESHTPECPHMTLICFNFLLEPRLSGCEWDFVWWPYERVPVSLADSCLPGGWNLCWFSQPDVIFIVGTSSWLWCSEMGSLAWGWNPTLLRRNPWKPSGFSASIYRREAGPFCISTLPTSLGVVSSVNPSL